ncbi:MAG: serine/threonine protein kinase [Vicinamibacterales bacterium]|nr:serine/threonine protein kinase [Vicinamibacterales bacterium]
MNSDQRRRAYELFEAVLEHEPADIATWLERSEPGDAEVRAEVLSLLDHHSRAGSFLTQPLAEAAPHLLEEDRVLEPGTVLGSYTIVRELGRGGMGRVYLASDATLGRTVALKALAPQLTRDPSHRERLRREARAAAVLTHPGICTVYALEEFDGELYIATEFLEGHTLRDEMADGNRPSTERVVATARELAAALSSAHARGVTHRDLKPENVMRTIDGRIKILDFGLARIEGPAAAAAGTMTAALPGALAGTPAYMSPEQIEGRAVGPGADVFAFGVLVYEWIAGAHPFQAGSPLATLARVIESTPESLATRIKAPVWLSDVVDRCLRKSAADRFATAAELARALEDSADTRRRAVGSNTWWRTHQLTMMALYILATTRAWQIKEVVRSSPTLWAFIFMGVAASMSGIIRGHLVFTDMFNRPHLTFELRRTRRATLVTDVLMASLLFVDALVLFRIEPLATVLTICLAIGIALATLLMEPATSTAVFGE